MAMITATRSDRNLIRGSKDSPLHQAVLLNSGQKAQASKAFQNKFQKATESLMNMTGHKRSLTGTTPTFSNCVQGDTLQNPTDQFQPLPQPSDVSKIPDLGPQAR